MLFRVTPDASTGRVRVEGEIDMAGAEVFERQLAPLLADRESPEVDMSGVTFIDSAGLRALYRCSESMNGNGPLVVVNPSRFVASLMKIAGFDGSGPVVLGDARD
jgi:anti-anti-sigma factor